MEEVGILSAQYLFKLKSKSFYDLSKLEDYHEEKIIKGENSGTIVTKKDTINDEQLRVVIQIYCDWILGIGNMYADGFRIKSNGEINNLTEEELFEFY